MMGQELFSSSVTEQSKIDISKFPSGAYVVKIEDKLNRGMSYSTQFIKH